MFGILGHRTGSGKAIIEKYLIDEEWRLESGSNSLK